MYKKRFYKNRAKISKRRKDISIFIASQGKFETYSEFLKHMERSKKW